MANTTVNKTQSDGEWLTKGNGGTDEDTKNGGVTIVNPTLGDTAAWENTPERNPSGQTYGQGTLDPTGGAAYSSSSYSVTDGAQNYLGIHIAGDGTPYKMVWDENAINPTTGGKGAYVAQTDQSTWTDLEKAWAAAGSAGLGEKIGYTDATAQQGAQESTDNYYAGRAVSADGNIVTQGMIDEAGASGVLLNDGTSLVKDSSTGTTSHVIVEYTEDGAIAGYKYVKDDDDDDGHSAGGGGGGGTDYAAELKSLLSQWKTAAENQQTAQIDYATQQGINELLRNLDDSRELYETQQKQISADERAAMDNSALYAELRGDKGGIGKAQYDSVMNTAATNRQTVASAQTKLATDTNREITDLRAQGEFEKADAVLQIAQSYLSQLMSLEQWAAEYNLSVEQFNESVRQWEAEFNESVRQYNTSLSASQTASLSDTLADTGTALLEAGIMPNASQLEAMGMDETQAQSYLLAQQLESSVKKGTLNVDEGVDDEDGTELPVTKQIAENFTKRLEQNITTATKNSEGIVEAKDNPGLEMEAETFLNQLAGDPDYTEEWEKLYKLLQTKTDFLKDTNVQVYNLS